MPATERLAWAEGLDVPLMEEGKEVDAYISGRKGVAYFNFRRRPIVEQWTGFSDQPTYDVAREIDAEIRRIVEEAHQVARDILSERRKELDVTSEILLRRETIDREQFLQLLDGKSEEEVFGADEPVRPQIPPPPPQPAGRAAHCPPPGAQPPAGRRRAAGSRPRTRHGW